MCETNPMYRNLLLTLFSVPLFLGAAPPTEEFMPQNVTVTAHVNAMFELK